MRPQASVPLVPSGAAYELKSDLAQYCLPAANRDDARKLAWANSICALFLASSVVSLKQPEIGLRVPTPPSSAREILIPATAEPEPEVVPEEIAITPEPGLPDPLRVPIAIEPIIVAQPRDVTFAVPIEGHIVVSTAARFVPPPPPIIPRKPDPAPQPAFRAIRFGDRAFRKQPPPNYPPEFQRSRIGGVVEVLFGVDTNGVPREVDVARSSGTAALDRHVCRFIEKEWRAYPGEAGHYRIAITFEP
jgi:protein TonB